MDPSFGRLLKMNQVVNNSLALVVQAWKVGNRNYTFESRGFAGLIKPKFMNGEALMRFHISIDGFFEDEQHTKPVTLDYSSHMFSTSILSQKNPENPNADAVRLDAFLKKFTQESYENVENVLTSYGKLYTSDPLYMK